MHHDEARFGNPSVFDPDHYKGQTALAPELANSSDYLLAIIMVMAPDAASARAFMSPSGTCFWPFRNSSGLSRSSPEWTRVGN
jgi:hypothetical protein